ncbi:MAG: hypothetical protein QXX95_08510 [Nitrososphaerales archaeon]
MSIIEFIVAFSVRKSLTFKPLVMLISLTCNFTSIKRIEAKYSNSFLINEGK